MQEPFDIELDGTNYAVFPEEDGKYTIFKEGEEYLTIQEDGDYWLMLDRETDLPMFDESEEVNRLGTEIKRLI